MPKPVRYPAKLRGRLAEMRQARQMAAEDKARVEQMRAHRREGADHSAHRGIRVSALALAMVGRRLT